jgi:hypothetical protein
MVILCGTLLYLLPRLHSTRSAYQRFTRVLVTRYNCWDSYTPVLPLNASYTGYITTVRLSFALISALGYGNLTMLQFLLDGLDAKDLLFANITVEEALWGYHDPLIDGVLAEVELLAKLNNVTLPPLPPSLVSKLDMAPGETPSNAHSGCGAPFVHPSRSHVVGVCVYR